MTILYVFIALIVGWVIGFLDSNIRTAQKIKAAELKAETAVKDAELKAAQAQQQNPQVTADDPGLLRLKNDNGWFTIEMDGAPIEDTLSPDKKKRLIELITILRPWVEGVPPPPPAAPVQASRLPDPSQPVSQPSGQKPSLQPPVGKKPEAEKNITTLSIVSQIDTVLQARLVDTPLAKRGVRLQESPIGEVEVIVGLDKFLSVDEVTDETIKATIRAAITEWETKFTPGL